MSYKVIEKNEYGVLVVDNDKHKSMGDICSQCKYFDNCNSEWMECIINTYYLPDSEAEKLEAENDLKAKKDEFEDCQHPYKFLERNENGLFCKKCKMQISNDPNIY